MNSHEATQWARGNVTGATSDHLPLLFDNETTPIDYGFRDVWFKWTAPVSGKLAIQAGANNFVAWGLTVDGPNEDGYYKVVGYDSTSSSYGGNVWYTDYTIDVEAGKTYYHALWCDDIQNPNAYTFMQVFTQNPLSDSFESRTQLGGTSFTVAGNNASYSSEEGEPDHGGSGVNTVGKSVWTTWRSPDVRRAVRIEVKSQIFQPAVAVYSGNDFSDLTLVARGTKSGDRRTASSVVTFAAEQGVDYHIAIDGTQFNSGSFEMTLTATPAKPGFLVQPVNTTVSQGETATFTTAVAYTGDWVTYQWERQRAGTKVWEPISDDDFAFDGAQTATLSVTTNLDMNNDKFRLVATDEVGSSTSKTLTLTVTEFPAVTTEILGTVNTNISLGNIPEPSNGGKYFATGLPKGLTLDPETGIISGIVTAKAGTYRVTYGSTNGKKKNAETYILQIIVAPFSPLLSGNFEVLLNAVDANTLPVGKVTLKVANNGNYTGSLFFLEDGKNYSFRGTLALDEFARTAGNPSDKPIIIKRGRSFFQLDLQLTEPAIDSPETTNLSAVLYDHEDQTLGEGADGVPVGNFTAANPAPWLGRYTLRLTDTTLVGTEAAPALPLGSGYATAEVNARTAALALRGRLADNTQFTANLAAGANATYRVAQKVHAPGGSLAGRITLVEQVGYDVVALGYHADAGTDSALYWVKPNRPKDKLYPAGFAGGSVRLRALMEPWVHAVGNFPGALGLSQNGDLRVRIIAQVPQDGNDNNVYGLPVDVRITPAGKFAFVEPAQNTTKFDIKIDPATGAFSGSYQLTEENAPPKTKPRKVSFSGVMTQYVTVFQGDVIGEGFAIVPPLTAEETTTSARIEFLAGEPDSPFNLPLE